MKTTSYLTALFSAVSAACLLIGFMLDGKVWVLAVLAAMAVLWLIIRRWSGAGSSLLLVYVALAAGGILLKVSAPIMVVGVTSALAAWDLSTLRQGPQSAAHGRSLAALLIVAPALAILGLQLDLHLPFGVMLFLALLAIGSLTFAVRQLLRSSP